MWNYQSLSRIDLRVVMVIISLMVISLLVISANSMVMGSEGLDEGFFTPMVKSQIKWFVLGSTAFIFFTGFDYNKLREFTWILYFLMLLSLIGLFFTDSIARVNRWYKIPLLGISVQPSEHAKLIVVMTLSWFLESKKSQAHYFSTTINAGIIVLIPFLLILKQPDLGTALVLYPITLVMFYFGNIHPLVTRIMTCLGTVMLAFVAIVLLGIVPHEDIRPYASKVMKEYQFDRLNPNTHHQKAALTAISLGGITGTGWRKSEFTGGGWLPAPYTDTVFPAFAEEFGFIGVLLIIGLFYALIYFSFQVCAQAKDHYGRLLSAGITVYLAMHIIINIGMMSGFLPITGVPLILVTYGGSSILVTMAALGILQSIYTRRFMF